MHTPRNLPVPVPVLSCPMGFLHARQIVIQMLLLLLLLLACSRSRNAGCKARHPPSETTVCTVHICDVSTGMAHEDYWLTSFAPSG